MGTVHHPGTPERAAAERDIKRIRDELRDRLDRCDAGEDGYAEAALRWLALEGHADAVNEALDETGAPA